MPADEAAGDKTEEATPRRRQKERERGNVAKSKDLAAASVLLGGMVMLRFGGHMILRYLSAGTERILRQDIAGLATPSNNEIIPYAYDWILWGLYASGPFMLGIFVIAVAANVLQVGFLFSIETLTINLDKLNPVNGMKRMFGVKSMVMLLMNLVKLIIVIVVAYLTLRTAMPDAAALASLGAKQIITHEAYAVMDLGLRLAMLFFILGLMDMGYQFYQHNRDMRMTKQEVKEDMKEGEGDPHIRARRRQIQRQMAMQRMMQEVPQAEVVVRNPTHFAVAVSYKPEMNRPIVVAKGTDKIALKIIEVAIKNGIPVWQDPPTARALFRTTEIGDPIPEELYAALAEILAHVLKGEKLAAYQHGGKAA